MQYDAEWITVVHITLASKMIEWIDVVFLPPVYKSYFKHSTTLLLENS